MIRKLLKLATRLYWNDSRIGKTAWTNYLDPYPYNCSTCTYFLKSDLGSCCNAFHTPQIGAIECADWTLATARRGRVWTDYVPLEHQRAIHNAVASQLPLPSDDATFCPRWLRQLSQYIKIPFPEYWETDRLVERAERATMAGIPIGSWRDLALDAR